MNQDAKSILARAVLKVLKPLVRVVLRHDMSHAEFAELVRRAYVDVAYEHFGIPGRKTTYSRVAVVTGLSRKEVVRLSKLRESAQYVVKGTPNRAIRVVNGWVSDAEFLDDKGEPAELPLQGSHGSFAALVARYSGDITLGAVLDELVRVGVAEQFDGENVRLLQIGYVPRENELEQIRILSVCAADLIHTGVHNLVADSDATRLQRQLVHRNVPEAVTVNFRDVATERATRLLQDLNAELVAGKRQHDDAPATHRVGIGVYYFEADNTDTEKQPSVPSEESTK